MYYLIITQCLPSDSANTRHLGSYQFIITNIGQWQMSSYKTLWGFFPIIPLRNGPQSGVSQQLGSDHFMAYFRLLMSPQGLRPPLHQGVM